MINDDTPHDDSSANDQRPGPLYPSMARSRFVALSLYVGWSCSSLTALAVLLTPQPVFGHHILGLPHYSYKDNYPQAPTLEYPATTGPYDVLMTSYPGRPLVGEAATVCFYIKDRNTDAPYDQAVTMRVLQTATFGENTVIYPPATHRPFDHQHKYTVTFPAEAEYIIELTMDVEGRSEVIPFLVVVGNPTATTSIIVTIVVSLAVFIVVVRAIKKKRDRRMAAKDRTLSPQASAAATPVNVVP